MPDFKKTTEGLNSTLSTLQKLVADILPKEKVNVLVNGKPCEVSLGGTGLMVTMTFTNAEDALEHFEKLKSGQ